MADKTTRATQEPELDGVREKWVDQGDGTWAKLRAISQATSSALNATVVQATASSLNATVAQTTAANLNATIVQATATALNAQVVGTVAHDGVDAGNPVKIGGKAGNTTLPAAVSVGDRVDAYHGLNGQYMFSPAAAISPNDAAAQMLFVDGAGTTRALGVLNWVWNGATADRLRTPTVFKSFSAIVITSESTIWTPTSGKKFRLMGYCITQGVATGAITVKDNTSGTTILTIPAHTVGVALVSPPMGNGILSAAANNVLTFTGASTETVTGFVFGTEE